MHIRKSKLAPAVVTLVALDLVAFAAHGQFGLPMQLPTDDFVWMWGTLREAQRNTFEDFSVTGNEAGFSCELTGSLSPASSISGPEIREFEADLRASLFFIQTAATAMNRMEFSREISWARLDCDKFKDEPDEATSKEREDKARERAERKREQRRARESD
jgi:hypothetical protein